LNVAGSRYAALNNVYILATVNPHKKRTLVTVQAYLVQNTVKA